ncbi:hypothetical protein [Methylobacterium oryzae]|uniref:hypothetical protein n=1 Tax=Methylobacterium oryzae TaxID=334852 RepID=UPI001F18B85B|nr:hypothetical protein [Methylobacterium oryzae]UIN36295.1 hypothetical protein LXM90_07285 [Methylobacterium oryzae]
MSAPVRLDLEACRSIAAAEMHAYAGRTMIGTVLRCGRSFMAFDLEERHRATTACVRSAMRALSSGASA